VQFSRICLKDKNISQQTTFYRNNEKLGHTQKKKKTRIKPLSERKTLASFAAPAGINPEGVKNVQSVSGSPDTEFLALSPSEEKWRIQFFISREDAIIVTLPEIKKESIGIWATDFFEEWWLSNLFHQL